MLFKQLSRRIKSGFTVNSRPHLFNFFRRNSGSIATCTGITSPALMARNTESRPRKRSLANAYPAIEFTISDNTVTVIEMIALFTRYRFIFNRMNTSR